MQNLLEFQNNFETLKVKVRTMQIVCLIEDKDPHDLWIIGVDDLELI